MWYPEAAQLIDDVSKNTFVLTDAHKEESFIDAYSIECQVCIAPVPFPPRRFLSSNRDKMLSRGSAFTNKLDTPNILSVILDRCADYDMDSSSDEDT